MDYDVVKSESVYSGKILKVYRDVKHKRRYTLSQNSA